MADVRNSQYANGDLPAVVPTPRGQFSDSGVGSDENYPAIRKFFQFVRQVASRQVV